MKEHEEYVNSAYTRLGSISHVTAINNVRQLFHGGVEH